jgi:hypothetical protein
VGAASSREMGFYSKRKYRGKMPTAIQDIFYPNPKVDLLTEYAYYNRRLYDTPSILHTVPIFSTFNSLAMSLSICLIYSGFHIKIINLCCLKSYNRYGFSGLFTGIT